MTMKKKPRTPEEGGRIATWVTFLLIDFAFAVLFLLNGYGWERLPKATAGFIAGAVLIALVIDLL